MEKKYSFYYFDDEFDLERSANEMADEQELISVVVDKTNGKLIGFFKKI